MSSMNPQESPQEFLIRLNQLATRELAKHEMRSMMSESKDAPLPSSARRTLEFSPELYAVLREAHERMGVGPPERLVATNRRVEAKKTKDPSFWTFISQKVNPIYWFSRRDVDVAPSAPNLSHTSEQESLKRKSIGPEPSPKRVSPALDAIIPVAGVAVRVSETTGHSATSSPPSTLIPGERVNQQSTKEKVLSIEQLPGRAISSSVYSVSSSVNIGTHEALNALVNNETSRRTVALWHPGPKVTDLKRRTFFDRTMSAVIPTWKTRYREWTNQKLKDAGPFIREQVAKYNAAKTEQETYAPMQVIGAWFLKKAFEEGLIRGSEAPSLVISANRAFIGTASLRRPDLIGTTLSEGDKILARGSKGFVDASTTSLVVEMKHNDTKTSRAPVTHNEKTDGLQSSTFSARSTDTPPNLSPTTQVAEQCSIALSAQHTRRRWMIGLLLTNGRLCVQLMCRGNAYVSEEVSMRKDLGLFGSTLVALFDFSCSPEVMESALVSISPESEERLLLPPDAFNTEDREVNSGPHRMLTNYVPPFKTMVQLVEDPSCYVDVLIFGHNQAESPPPGNCDEYAEPTLAEAPTTPAAPLPAEGEPRRVLRPRTSRVQLAPVEEPQQDGVVEEAKYSRGTPECPRQYPSRDMFDTAPIRLSGRIAGLIEDLTAQLSLRSKGSPAQPPMMRMLNERGFTSVPTLVASYTVADMDRDPVLSRLRHEFGELIRDTNKELVVEVFQERMRPLLGITNIAHLLLAFEGLVRAIIDLYALGILHTAISPANVLVDDADPGRILLIGFENALIDEVFHSVDDTPDVSLTADALPEVDVKGPFGPLIRHGIYPPSPCPHVPFNARSRSSDQPGPHLLSHDLESAVLFFLWIVKFCRRGRLEYNADMKRWYTDGWKRIEKEKNDTLQASVSQPTELAAAFADSLGVSVHPIARCCQRLGELTLSGTLSGAGMMDILREARSGYE